MIIILKTFEEMCDDETICNYCYRTDYGECKSCSTPNGYISCEGAYCDESYESYLEENKTTENIVRCATKIKLKNKGDFEFYE